MFGLYLKEARLMKGLNQSKTAALLNLSGGDLCNIDVVTLSRWERGVTTPKPSRRIRVLRALKNNLMSYLTEISKTVSSDGRAYQFDYCLKARFESATAVQSRLNYVGNIEASIGDIHEHNVNKSNLNEFLVAIDNFYAQYPNDKFIENISNLDLLLFQESGRGRMLFYKSDNMMLGHNLAFLFKSDDLRKEIYRLSPKMKIKSPLDLNVSKPLTKDNGFSYLSLSQHSMNINVFRKLLHTEFEFLAKNSNIHHYYFYASEMNTVTALLKMGFSVVAYDEYSPFGAIKVGVKRYMKAIMYIETSDLFTQPEFLYVLKKFNDG